MGTRGFGHAGRRAGCTRSRATWARGFAGADRAFATRAAVRDAAPGRGFVTPCRLRPAGQTKPTLRAVRRLRPRPVVRHASQARSDFGRAGRAESTSRTPRGLRPPRWAAASRAAGVEQASAGAMSSRARGIRRARVSARVRTMAQPASDTVDARSPERTSSDHRATGGGVRWRGTQSVYGPRSKEQAGRRRSRPRGWLLW